MPSGEYFFLKSHLNGLVVSVSAAKNSASAKLSMGEKKTTGHDNQLWFLHRETDTIRSRLNGHILDFQGILAASLNTRVTRFREISSANAAILNDIIWPIQAPVPLTDISIEFEIRPKFAVLWFKMHSTDHDHGDFIQEI